MSFLTKLLRFALPVVIVLAALQLVVLGLYKTDTSPTIAEVPVPSKVYKLQTEALNWLTAVLYQLNRDWSLKDTARLLSEISLEERQQYLEEFTAILEAELRESGLEDHTDQAINEFIKKMNESGIYFE